ncbi:hypothetical protein [Streptomyces sp. NPDC001315]|uniref:hypothetical protein n=1 Tax=Streptomyces sp. NPDC001315 TaxID=3364562 RepID=UPI003698618C
MVVLLLFTGVCCAAPVSNAISAYVAMQTGLQDDGGIADGGTAADIPARMLTAYKKAVQQVGKYRPRCQGMRWPILAGIAKVESNHAIGRNVAAGAPMSLLPWVTSTSVHVNTGGLNVPVGQVGTVTVTVTCTVNLSDLLLPGVPGARTLTSTAVSVVDQYRQRGD